MKLAGVLGALGLALLPAAAAADPIIFTQTRTAGTIATLTFSQTGTQDVASNADVLTTTANLVGASGTSTANATLLSTIDPFHLSGSSTISSNVSTTTGAYAYGYSSYIVGLTLDQAYDFSFTGQFFGTGTTVYDPNQPNTKTSWQAALRSAAENVEYFDDRGEGAQTITHTLRLAPGNWLFYANGYADGSTHVPGLVNAQTAFRFTADLTSANGPGPSPTPEPASMLLLASGLAGLFAARGKSRAWSQRRTS